MGNQKRYKQCAAPLAQLDRASGYGPEGQEFESLRVRHYMPLHTVRGHTSFSTQERERAKARAKRGTVRFESLRVRHLMPLHTLRGHILFLTQTE